MAAITDVDIATQTRREHERSDERWASTKVANCTAADLQRARAAGFEPDAEGEWFVGRDPRRMTPAELFSDGNRPYNADASDTGKMSRLLRWPFF